MCHRSVSASLQVQESCTLVGLTVREGACFRTCRFPKTARYIHTFQTGIAHLRGKSSVLNGLQHPTRTQVAVTSLGL